MDGERLYTLSEAHTEINRNKCAVEGHDVLWIPTRYQSDGPNTPGPLYGCTRCSVRCLIVYPLDHLLVGDGEFVHARRIALRRQCTEPRQYKYSADGHDLVPLNQREEWVCTRCDALATFQEKW